MGIDIKISIDLSPLQKRIVRFAVVSGAVVAALGVGLAMATPHQWNTNDPLKATDLNRLNVLTYTPDGGTTQMISVGATMYCGATSTSYTGAMGGYEGAKAACQTTCASTTAHMCTSEELIRSQAVGAKLGAVTGWYASGVLWLTTEPSGIITSDCGGSGTFVEAYTQTQSNDGAFVLRGALWQNGGPNTDVCTDSYSIMCCD